MDILPDFKRAIYKAGIIVLIVLNFVIAGKRCCSGVGCFTDSYPFDDMPLPQCPESMEVNLKLYTRDNLKKGQVITRTTVPPVYNAKKKTVLLAHGYLNWGEIWYLHDMKDAFLQKYDYNVIILGWGGGAIKIFYPQAAANTRTVGAHVAEVVKNLVRQTGSSQCSIWCVGQSLGSHVCGHLGQRIKIGRVTGLDPAGPWFEDKDWSVGINPSVADFVDIWHTNGQTNLIMGFGTMKRLGHVDFYINGGGQQPGCIFDPMMKKQGKDSLSIDLTPFCSHLRVIELFRESITSKCQMYARHFCVDESNIPRSCFACGGICALMGMDAPKYKLKGMFYLTTNSASPYCVG